MATVSDELYLESFKHESYVRHLQKPGWCAVNSLSIVLNIPIKYISYLVYAYSAKSYQEFRYKPTKDERSLEEQLEKVTKVENYYRRKLAMLEAEAGMWGRQKKAKDVPVGRARQEIMDNVELIMA